MSRAVITFSEMMDQPCGWLIICGDVRAVRIVPDFVNKISPFGSPQSRVEIASARLHTAIMCVALIEHSGKADYKKTNWHYHVRAVLRIVKKRSNDPYFSCVRSQS